MKVCTNSDCHLPVEERIYKKDQDEYLLDLCKCHHPLHELEKEEWIEWKKKNGYVEEVQEQEENEIPVQKEAVNIVSPEKNKTQATNKTKVQTTTQEFKWSKPLPKFRTIQAGDIWEFTWPLIINHSDVVLNWSCSAWKKSDEDSKDLVLKIKVPDDVSGNIELNYEISGATKKETGVIQLRILPIPQKDPLLGNYEVHASRKSIQIPQLTTQVKKQEGLLVGKFSARKGIFPDIDLKNHFETKQKESYCSREQARIYWKDQWVYLKNIGKHPIKLPQDKLLQTDQSWQWAENETITLPGGIELSLKEEQE